MQVKETEKVERKFRVPGNIQNTLTEKQKNLINSPSFRDPETMTVEQLTDPDYALKQIMKSNGAHPLTCSKCHHCR